MKSNSDKMTIKVNQLTKVVPTSEGELQILQPIDLHVNQGETIAIVGASGSGKSTLLSLLAGLDTPTQGEIWFNDLPLHQLDEEQRAEVRANNIGFIFQSFLLVQSLTAFENIMLPAELAGDSNAKEKAQQWLEKVGLEHRANHFPNQLSGGEQQRVAIARAFITDPAILFADEPTGNLDAANSDKIEKLLFDLNKDHGTTLILVTHDNELAGKCSRRCHMQAGQIIETYENEEVAHVV